MLFFLSNKLCETDAAVLPQILLHFFMNEKVPHCFEGILRRKNVGTFA